MIKKDGVSLMHNLCSYMTSTVREDNPVDTFRQVLWEHQLEALKKVR